MITRINYNWRPCSDGDQSGEDYDSFVVGSDGVTEIREHSTFVEGDKWFYDVYFENGPKARIFNPNMVVYDKQG